MDVFIARFLQHVLPRGFTKIRYYGLLSPTRRADLERARSLLDPHAAPRARPSATPSETTPPGSTLHDSGQTGIRSSGGDIDTASVAVAMTGAIIVAIIVAIPAARHCPACGRGQRRLVARYRRSRAPPR